MSIHLDAGLIQEPKSEREGYAPAIIPVWGSPSLNILTGRSMADAKAMNAHRAASSVEDLSQSF